MPDVQQAAAASVGRRRHLPALWVAGMSKSRAKGTRGENLAVEFLREELGPQVERRVTAGANDKGDLAGIEGVCVEVKWCAAMDLGNWMREAETEAIRAGMALPVLMHNRRRAKAGDNYATVPWWALRYFLRLHLDQVERHRITTTGAA